LIRARDLTVLLIEAHPTGVRPPAGDPHAQFAGASAILNSPHRYCHKKVNSSKRRYLNDWFHS
jgi:hypothetical protein